MPADFIDVLVAIDATSIVDSLGHNHSDSNPPIVNPTHVAIIGTKQSSKDNNLSFHFTDAVYWQASAIGRAYECEIYDFFDNSKNVEISSGDLIDRPRLESFHGVTLTPNPNSPNSPTVNRTTLWHWTSLAEATGQISCGIRFVIFNNEGIKMGYYQCNTTITVS